MKALSENLSLEKYKVKKTKHKYAWQEDAEKLTQHFNQNCFWIFHKYDRWWINKAFNHCVEKNKPFGYMLGLLNGYSLNSEKILENIRLLYKNKKKEDILILIKKFGWKLSDEQKSKIMSYISDKKALEKIREAYRDGQYYEVKKLLRTHGWLLTKEKYNDILIAVENIKPSKLLEEAHEIMGEK